MTTLLRALALALALLACHGGRCDLVECVPPDAGDPPDGCAPVNGSCGPARGCCGTDPLGNALACDADAGACATTCGPLLAACGPGAPCCARTSGGYSLECAQGACAQCLGAGAPCGQDDTPCCAGTTCRPTSYSGYSCQ